MVSRTAQLSGKGPLSGAKLSGVVLNTKRLRRVDQVLKENPKAEFMYLRDNEIRRFAPEANLEYLRVLDLSLNQIGPSVDFLPLLPHLHHLYLSVNKIDSLAGFSGLVSLETLCISDNAISSFEGLGSLPNLRVLSLSFNNISNFNYFPSLPNLHTINLAGNPVCNYSSYRSMTIALNNNNLVSIDGVPVKDEERVAVAHYQGKVVYCIRNGFVIEDEGNVHKSAAAFIKEHHHAQSLDDNGIVRLVTMRITSGDGPNRFQMKEGNEVQLYACLQDVRPLEEASKDLFSSPHLIPTVFTFKGAGSEAFLMGSFNGWTEPLAMQVESTEEENEEECPTPTPAQDPPAEGEEGEEAAVVSPPVSARSKRFKTILYLPPGEYNYHFLLDNVVAFDRSKSCRTSSNQEVKYHVCEVKEDTSLHVEEKNTIFHIRWMHQASTGVFELLEREHDLRYTPNKGDIGCCLRAEILSYVKGEYSFLFMDMTSPVQPSLPMCTRLEIKGEAKENQVLLVEADYFGGEEGSSSLTWTRITPSGEELPIFLQNSFAGFKVTKDCIGCKIKVTFTPVRNDWVPGEPKTAMTDRVVEGRPECASIKILGNLMENCDLGVEVVYTGGKEGKSRYQWLRKGTSGQYLPIPGETRTTYHTTAADIGKSLAVEYTPVNDKGKEGEACRCVLDNLIAPSSPEVQNIRIYGELRENELLELKYDFTGGEPGQHMIRWYRRHPGMKHPTKIGTNNSVTLRLTSKEVGAVIEVTMTPVRSDKVHGNTVLAKTASSVLPARRPERLTPFPGTSPLASGRVSPAPMEEEKKESRSPSRSASRKGSQAKTASESPREVESQEEEVRPPEPEVTEENKVAEE